MCFPGKAPASYNLPISSDTSQIGGNSTEDAENLFQKYIPLFHVIHSVVQASGLNLSIFFRLVVCRSN